MGLSSNTIIHFTSKKEFLKGILSENFRLKYCKETIQWTNKDKFTLHVPMISFCDIPLSQIKNHISNYGHYGIGLSREWAIRNKLNPVLYVEPDSHLSASYRKVLSFFGTTALTLPETVKGDTREAIKQALDVARYIKNYEGPLTRRGKTIEKYRYSDEREWRYVPEYSSPCKILYTVKEFSKEGTKEEAAEKISDMRLEFEPNDVKYIIIKNDTEISEFVEHLRRAKGKTYSHDDIERLTTRLLTSEQIHNDI